MNKIIPCSLIVCSFFGTAHAIAGSHHDVRGDANYAHQQSSHARARDWQSGQYLPPRYHARQHAVDHRSVRHLPHPGRHQQWYRVDHQYVLINRHDHRIVRTHH